jgi:alpha-glucosidase
MESVMPHNFAKVCAGFSLALMLQASAGIAAPAATPWWRNAVIYEIYPRSFQDSDGNGVGDLNGITARLDYIKSLGVDAIWLTPIYPSPQVDFGYDVSDYKNIDPQYGTLDDFDRLVQEAKKRNIRVIMDLVLNHTSDKHPWFLESSSSRDNPKRDWYVWRDGRGAGQPPNNWMTSFHGSGWQYDAKTGQYYWHRFYPEQPDLNWRNPQVPEAMYDIVRFWIARGVDGFRLDAIGSLFEDPQMRDDPVVTDTAGNPVLDEFGNPKRDRSRSNYRPEIHDVLRQIRKAADQASNHQAVLIGETNVARIADLRALYGANNDELHLPMNLKAVSIETLDIDRFRTLIDEVQTSLGTNPALFVFDNHDRPRWDRYGDGVHNDDIGRVLATILLGARGAAMYYYGDEIGMVTTTPSRREDVRDPVGRTGWPNDKGRDGVRTPMQWTAAPNAGFSPTGAETWLPIPPHATANVTVQDRSANSLLSWYRQLGALRRTDNAMRNGDQIMLNKSDQHVLAWARQTAKESMVFVCNFTALPQQIRIDPNAYGLRAGRLTTLLNSPGQAPAKLLQDIRLKPYGVMVIRIR